MISLAMSPKSVMCSPSSRGRVGGLPAGPEEDAGGEPPGVVGPTAREPRSFSSMAMPVLIIVVMPSRDSNVPRRRVHAEGARYPCRSHVGDREADRERQPV